MLTFRARGVFEVDWTLIQVDGENEEDISHIIAAKLSTLDYELLVAQDEGEYGPLEEGWL